MECRSENKQRERDSILQNTSVYTFLICMKWSIHVYRANKIYDIVINMLHHLDGISFMIKITQCIGSSGGDDGNAK